MVKDIVPPDIGDMSFEAALSEMESIVHRLEKGAGGLDEAIEAYERGAALKRHCEAKLQEAQNRVEKIVLGPDGSVGVESADVD